MGDAGFLGLAGRRGTDEFLRQLTLERLGGAVDQIDDLESTLRLEADRIAQAFELVRQRFERLRRVLRRKVVDDELRCPRVGERMVGGCRRFQPAEHVAGKE